MLTPVRRHLAQLVSLVCLMIPTLAWAQSPPVQTPPSGEEIVALAAARMTLHPSLEAKMRQRIAIREQYMVGSGAYLQLRHRDDVRFRLELRLQVGEHLGSLQHINDNRYVYIRRDLGATKTISRIDLKRIHEAQSSGIIPPNYASLGIGGLSQLLHGLADNFTFDVPASETISGVNVWRMNGRWRPEVVAKLLPEQSERILAGEQPALDQLPLQFPHEVSLVVGRDGPLPLFPYRVEYTRHDQRSNRSHSMLVMELFEVRLRPDLDPRLFDVSDSEHDLVDETDAYLRKHDLVSAE